jgi:flagellin
MAISIRTNSASLSAQRQLNNSQKDLDSSLARLSSGYRINKAADDAAGLAISEKLKAQINGINQGIRNAQDGISLIQTAEGGVSEIQNIVQRIRELAVQASNETYAGQDQKAIGVELRNLREEINNISGRTTFNGHTLIGSKTGAGSGVGNNLWLQIGANISGASQSNPASLAAASSQGTVIATNEHLMVIKLQNFRADANNASTAEMASIALLVGSFYARASAAASAATTNASNTAQFIASAARAARQLIVITDGALAKISDYRADLGARQNRLDHVIQVQTVAAENLTASESRIRDVDVASETAKMTKANILSQAGISVLAQANQMPQMALKLLG